MMRAESTRRSLSTMTSTTTAATSYAPESSRIHRENDEVGWVLDGMVQMAKSCNNLLSKNACHLCNVYVDKQLEFEQRQECIGNGAATQAISPVERVWMRTVPPEGLQPPQQMEVDLYKQFLFDEDSVVDTVSSREDDDHNEYARRHFRQQQQQPPFDLDDHTITTQRTH